MLDSTSESNSFSEVAITAETKTNVTDDGFNNIIQEFNSQKDELEEKLRQLKNREHEIDMMKMGSIAKIEQITTV